jgi:CheY-like chemotaxis protein
MIDVSRRKQLEEQIGQRSKLESIGRLAGGIAHDFNNMLAEIVGFGGFVQEALPEGDPRRTDMGHVLAAAARATSLTRQLLTFSRQQPAEKRPTNLAQQLAELVPFLRRTVGEHIALHVALGPDPAVVVLIDPVQFDQVAMNLVVNARDAMPTGGSLDVTLATAGAAARLSVTDTGIGMDAATQRRIFEPFFTTKGVGQGTGLGLATCFGIVADAGGTIVVTSTPGHGTTFVVTIPLAAAADRAVSVPPASAPAPARARPGQGEEVLFCEDEVGLRQLGRRVLEAAGYQVHTAADGAEALKRIDELGPRLAVIVTDVVMPGASGDEVAAYAARVIPHVPVLLTSGYFDDTLRLATRGTPVLWKPLRPADLIRAVARAIADRNIG